MKKENEGKRSFTKLKKDLGTRFDSFCKSIAKEYANSEAHFARRYFCGYYKMSESCFYKVLKYASVDDETAEKIRQKKKGNARHHVKVHEDAVAATYPIDKVQIFAKDFAEHQNLSKYDLVTKYDLPSARVADLILLRAIEENIADDKTVDAIEERSIKNAVKEKKKSTKVFFEKLRQNREAHKKVVP